MVVEPKEYWDKSALKNPYSAILTDATSPEIFWKMKLGLEFVDDLSPEGIFLDLGCGIGRIVRYVAPRVKEYWGLDISENMIKLATEEHRNYDNVRFVVGNGTDLECLNDETFDYVFTFLLFQHILPINTESYVNETYRVLKKEGTFFCLTVPTEFYKGSGINRESLDKTIKSFRIVSFEKTKHYYNLVLRK